MSARIAYVIIGDVAVINVKSLEEARSETTLEKALEIMRRHKRVRAVYAKIETSGEYRIPRLIHIAGEEINETWHRENGIEFHVTLGKVYFNPRLSSEHLRVARLLEELGSTRVLDMFSGVGGYAVTAAIYTQSLRLVVANDLNVYAVRDLVYTLARNRRRIKSEFLVLNYDSNLLPSILQNIFDAIIMDNPHYTEMFINTACKLAAPSFHLFLYFVSSEDDASNKLEQLLRMMKCARCSPLDLREVIDYAPRKYVYGAILECERT